MIILDFLLSLALLLVTYVGKLLKKPLVRGKTRISQKRAVERTRLLQEDASRWLVDYYKRKGRDAELYAVPGYGDLRIPYLTKETWYGDELKTVRFELMRGEKNELVDSSVETEKKLIKYREALGHKIWDDPVLRSMGIQETQNEIIIKVGACSYFQYLSTCGKLEDEVCKCVSSPRNKPVLRDEMADCLETLSSAKLGVQILGFAVATVLRCRDGWKVIIPRRSEETGIGASSYAVVPSFTCHPFYLQNSREDLGLFYFLLEFAEELCGWEELCKLAMNEHIDSDWFLSHEPLKTLLALHKSGAFSFKILGLGFDALRGELNVAALALIDDVAFSERELPKMKRNWEIKKKQTRLRALDLDSSELKQRFLSNEIYHTSAFCLSQVFEKMRSIGK
ncbi:hypothetical protein ES708_02672 [subsurface metagenome]